MGNDKFGIRYKRCHFVLNVATLQFWELENHNHLFRLEFCEKKLKAFRKSLTVLKFFWKISTIFWSLYNQIIFWRSHSKLKFFASTVTIRKFRSKNRYGPILDHFRRNWTNREWRRFQFGQTDASNGSGANRRFEESWSRSDYDMREYFLMKFWWQKIVQKLA